MIFQNLQAYYPTNIRTRNRSNYKSCFFTIGTNSIKYINMNKNANLL